jgi:hypothetical protein
VSSGAGRILVKPKDMPLAVRYLDVDMADNVTDLVHSDVKLAPGDEVTLTVDSGSAGFVLLRLQNARKA